MLLEALYNPDLLEKLDPDGIIEVFEATTEILRQEPPYVKLNYFEGEAVFAGDTHGDFSTTKYIIKKFLTNKTEQYLIFLGDYIDREPEPEGSLYNLLYLCLLKINIPDRVFLLKGNHEAHYSVFCYPYAFDRELIEIFGNFGIKIHNAAVSLFKEMPLMIKTTNGVIASHAGFPLHGQEINDKSRQDLIIDILWSDADISPMFRGFGIPKFTEDQLIHFLKTYNASCFIRGHDYNVAGKSIYSNRCITVFTCRRYSSIAGIKIARVDLAKKINDAAGVILEEISPSFDTLL
ncbi:metallophosphoesterase family protein [Thermodesulfovibrio thiophilus]|uniref:metallophosphoesterase family protein n=1 Tax=Thermodesulfovibrio thiophilus TaxID=340095 RepID=UPI0017E6C38D|nr:metallophosphoesterase family protein [Thermodesulfovibrio thiophilus]HHW20858.1 serine/threonine protein phosphatase [Thermodesulfovibrio thiophilus]